MKSPSSGRRKGKSPFAENLKKARKDKGWSQEGAAVTIGIKRSLLGAYEEDRAFPPRLVLEKIARAYDIDDLLSFISDYGHFSKEDAPVVKMSEFERKYNSLEEPIKSAVDLILNHHCQNL